MTQIFLHVTLISLLFFCEQRPVLVAAEMPSKQAAPIGERLTYDISWLNILAGTAVMEVRSDGTGGDASHAKLVTIAQSRPAIT